MLNAIYNLPNIVLLLVGGILVDRFGAARMLTLTAAICFAGALLTAYGPAFTGMAGGRLLFGIGAETFNIATFAAVVRYFPQRHLAFAMGLSMALGRGGAYSVDMSPTWFAGAYAGGWQPPLEIAALFAASSLVACGIYAWLDRRNGPRTQLVRSRAALFVPRRRPLRARVLVPARAVRALVFGDLRVPEHVLDQVFPARARARPRGRRRDQQLRLSRGAVRDAGFRLALRSHRPLRAVSRLRRVAAAHRHRRHGPAAGIARPRHGPDRHQLFAGARRDVAADREAGAGEPARHGARPHVGRAERRHRRREPHRRLAQRRLRRRRRRTRPATSR